MRIYKRSDRIKVKIEDITVTLAPLSFDQKSEAQEMISRGTVKQDLRLLSKGIAQMVKYSVKKVDGLEDAEGNPYQLDFDGDSLSDSCLDDLLNLEVQEKLQSACLSLLRGIPREIVDSHGKPIQGVEVIRDSKEAPANP
jgi:hypothetical protein